MKSLHRFLGIASATSAIAFVSFAQASSIGGYGGTADNTDEHYQVSFVEDANGAQGRWGPERWDILLPVDSATAYAPGIGVIASQSIGDVSCTVQASAQNGSIYSNTPWVGPTQVNTFQVVWPGVVNVPGNGTLEAACVFGNNSAVTGVNW